MVTFGFELEVGSGAASVLAQLQDDQLIGPAFSHLHAYHCACDDCTASVMREDGYLFKAQEDCTCNGEFITGILEYGSPEADRAIDGISRALLLSGARTTGNNGNHVHVDRRGLDESGMFRLYRLFCRYQDSLSTIASGPDAEIRGYNTRMRHQPGLWTGEVSRRTPYNPNDLWSGVNPYQLADGSYLAWKSPTVEFRLWNATKAAWRIRTHVGLSVAMVLAAQDGVDCTEHDSEPLESKLNDYLDAPTWAGILRQRFSKGGLDVAA